MHDEVAVVEGKDVGGHGAQQPWEEPPWVGKAEEEAHLQDHAEGEGLPADAALSLVRVDDNGVGAGEEGEEDDDPWGLSGAVNELVHLFFSNN